MVCFTVLRALRKRLIAEKFTSSGSSGREILYSLAIRAICEFSKMITSIFGYLEGYLLILGLDVRRKQRLMRSQCSDNCESCSGRGLRL